MTTIVSKTNYTSDSNNFTLSNGSSSGRVVVVIAAQNRIPADISAATFDGKAGTGIEVGRHTTATELGTLIAYWDDANLPSGAGSFNITCNSEIHTVFELSGWDEVAPEMVAESLTELAWTSPYQINLSGTDAGTVMLLAVAKEAGSDVVAAAGETLEQISASRAGIVSKVDSANDGFITLKLAFDSSKTTLYSAIAFNSAGGTDYTIRKGSTATITHTLTAAGLTSATLNGQAVTIGAQSGQTAAITFTDTITTSGEYALVLGDGVGTQTLTVQYNVIGLPATTIKKDGAGQANLTDIEITLMNGSFGNRVIVYQKSGATTDASGNSEAIVVPNAALVVGGTIYVVQRSFNAGIGIAYGSVLELL